VREREKDFDRKRVWLAEIKIGLTAPILILLCLCRPSY
jgi:hypothetical protein